MNADPKTVEEIVKALCNDYASDLHVMDDMRAAADLIESLQAKLAEARLGRNSEEAFKNHYKAQLAESQRRERAAVEDIEFGSCCVTCAYSKIIGLRSVCALGSKESCNDGVHGYKKWQWRGPQDGKGVNDGAE